MQVRSTAASMLASLSYLLGFLSIKSFFKMVAAFSLNGTFWFFSVVSFIAVAVLYFILPETEGKTLEEIQAFFDKDNGHNRTTASKRHDESQTHSNYGSI